MSPSLVRTGILALAGLAVLMPLPAEAKYRLPDKLALIALLKQGKYATLDKRLSAYQRAYESDPAAEHRVNTAFYAFASSDPGLKPKLNAWNERMPASYAAPLARGVYYYSLGFASAARRWPYSPRRSNLQPCAAIFGGPRPTWNARSRSTGD